MIRKILAVLVGLIIGSFAIYGIQYISQQVYPSPEGMDFNNMNAVKEFIASLPSSAFLLLLVSYAVGSLIGGMISALLVKERRITTALITGAIFLIFGGMNLIMIPHPAWFAIVSSAIYLPFAFIGGIVALRIKKS